MSKNKKVSIKAILLGESGVGKTNLINVSIGLNFNENSKSTFSNSFVQKSFMIDNKEYILNLWDTIGQEKFRKLTRIFFNDSKIVIFVYDKTSKKSFDELQYWIEEIKNVLEDNIILAIVGNKDDLDDEEVDEETARELAKKINAKFRMASAKVNGKGFVNFLKELLEDYINSGNSESKTENISLDAKEHIKTEPKKKKFC